MNINTEEQNKFINYDGDKSIILSACAGSGKTKSSVDRLNKIIADGVDPSRIIFFSFTNDAVNELKSRIDHDVKITTIHSFTSSILGKMGLFRPIVTFYDFVNWYKETYKPKPNVSYSLKEEFQDTINKFYEEGTNISATFSAYKLQNAEGIKIPRPKYFDSYDKFMKEKKARDFADMLIDTEKLTRNPTYKDFFVGLYDYIFIDEYQDTSAIQMKILLAIKGKQYYIIGDVNQSIYGFSGANCDEIEALLKKSYETVTMTLTKNFRSHKKIVEHTNKYSTLKATPHSQEDGEVHFRLIKEPELTKMMTDGKPLTILARTNAVIKDIEMNALIKKRKMRYFNYLTPTDIDNVNNGKINPSIKRKLDKLTPYFKNTTNLLQFIEDNKESDVFITTIHKSKGREFPRCVVINSIDPTLLTIKKHKDEYSYVNSKGDIDYEAKNVHYVAISRSKYELYFMLYEN